jgi:hypothetical protein
MQPSAVAGDGSISSCFHNKSVTHGLGRLTEAMRYSLELREILGRYRLNANHEGTLGAEQVDHSCSKKDISGRPHILLVLSLLTNYHKFPEGLSFHFGVTCALHLGSGHAPSLPVT